MVQLSKDEIIKITQRLQNVRQGLVQKAPFYAILLFGLRFSLDDMVERVYTDGERIAFNPDFLKEISDKELEFIMLHEVSHVALGHPFRCVKDYDIEIFDEACDIVVNSNIYHYMGDDESFITIKGLGVMPHKNYEGEEGYKFSVEQVYEHLFKIKGKKKKEDGIISDLGFYDEEDFDEDDEFETVEEDEGAKEDDLDSEDSEDAESKDCKGKSDKKKKTSKKNKKKLKESGDFLGEDNDELESEEECDDFVDEEECNDSADEEDEKDSSEEDGEKVAKNNNKGQKGKKKSSNKSNGSPEEGKGFLGEDNDELESEEECDGSVLSRDGKSMASKKVSTQTEKEQTAPLKKSGKTKIDNKIIKENKQILLNTNVKITCFDDHSFWKGDDEKDLKKQTWNQRVVDAYQTSEIIMQDKVFSKLYATKSFGGAPMFAKRLITELTEGKLDWKTLLNDFVQEEICDYSFSPPDRRFGDSDFFLPDFNEKTDSIKNVWFVVDTSGSISDRMIMDAYNEIASAVEIFGGNIESFLSFTESFITKPVPFSSVDDLLAIKPKGGGGNNFKLIFKYLETGEGLELKDKNRHIISIDKIIEPSCIVIITDGYDEFPKESMAKGIPVLWLINNNDPEATPPWGMVARIPQKSNQNDM